MDYPELKVTPLSDLFTPTNSPALKNIQFIVVKDEENKCLTFFIN